MLGWVILRVKATPHPERAAIGIAVLELSTERRELNVPDATRLPQGALAVMHGSSYRGDGGRLLSDLAGVIKEEFDAV